MTCDIWAVLKKYCCFSDYFIRESHRSPMYLRSIVICDTHLIAIWINKIVFTPDSVISMDWVLSGGVIGTVMKDSLLEYIVILIDVLDQRDWIKAIYKDLRLTVRRIASFRSFYYCCFFSFMLFTCLKTSYLNSLSFSSHNLRAVKKNNDNKN